MILIDDGGQINVEAVVAPYRHLLNIAVLREQNRGPAAARNYGATQAIGDYIAFTDDDCEPSPGWLRAFEETYAGRTDAICGGPLTNRLSSNSYSEATQKLLDYLHEQYNPISTPGAFFTTNNLCVPRSGFLELGGFDECMRFGEDREFCYRWTVRGKRFLYAKNAAVRHSHQLDFWSFLRLHFLYGQGTALFRERSADKQLPRIKLSTPLWYIRLILSGVLNRPSIDGLRLSALLFGTQVAAAAGLFWGSLHHSSVIGGSPADAGLQPISPSSAPPSEHGRAGMSSGRSARRGFAP